MDESSGGARVCVMCGAALSGPGGGKRGGRPANYCSNACRQRAFRRRAGAARPPAIPGGPDQFVGRRRELAQLRRQFSGARLVTLTGPGGVGKSRMAAEFAGAAGSVQVWTVELDPVHQPGQVLAALATALGVDGRRQPVLDAACELLSARRNLVVFDNCEHLAEPCADLIETLLDRCPRLRVLATSREPLRAKEEAVVRLGVLSLPPPGEHGKTAALGSDAVRLFTARAVNSAPGFALTEDNAATVAEICRRVDGLPLAVELAARRAGTLTPAQILGGLTDQLDLLTEGRSTGPARHRELRAAIAWSYRLLSPAERKMFRRLCVLTSDFDADAVCEVVPAGHEVRRVLLSLEAKSLLHRSGQLERFRLLNTVRSFGLERLTACGELTETRDRLALRVARIAEPTVSRLFFGGPASAAIVAERADLAAAVEHTASRPDDLHTVLAVAQARLWWHLQDANGAAILTRAIALDPDRRTAHHADALASLAWLTTLQRDTTTGVRLAIEAVGLAARRAVGRQLTRALDILGRIHLFRDEFDQAVEAYRGCVRHAEADEQPMCQRNLAWALILAGRLDEAEVLVSRALSAERVVLSLRMRGALMHTSGLLQFAEGDLDGAEASCAAALKATSSHSYYASYCVDALGLVAAGRGDHYRASILLAGAAATRAILDLDPEPAWRRRIEEAAVRSAEALGRTKAAAAAAYGGNLKPDHLVTHALRRQASDNAAPPGPGPAEHPLTDREFQVVALVAAGLTNPQIALRLHIGASTVKTHLAGIRIKLGLRSRTQMAVWYTAVRQVS